MKINYEYDIGGVKVNTREAARIIQRSLREKSIAKSDIAEQIKVPRIIQKMTVTKVVR